MDLNNNEDIRNPDSPFIDRLIDNDFDLYYDSDSDYDYDLERAITETMNNILINENINEICFEEEKNDCNIIDLLPIFYEKMKRLIKYDEKIQEIYLILEPILNIYEKNNSYFHILDEDVYYKIFNILKTIRIPDNECKLLQSIIVKQLN